MFKLIYPTSLIDLSVKENPNSEIHGSDYFSWFQKYVYRVAIKEQAFMVAESRLEPKLSDRFEILYHLFQGEPISHLIDKLDDRAVSGFQKFVWEKTVEFGLICRGKHFDRREVTKKMKPTPAFQREQRCTQPVYNCKGTQCIFSNSKCARKKIKEHVDVMAEAIQEYIRVVKKQELY